MTKYEQALFTCLAALVDTLDRSGAMDRRNYVLRVAAAIGGAADADDELRAVMEQHVASLLPASGYPDGIGTSGEPH